MPDPAKIADPPKQVADPKEVLRASPEAPVEKPAKRFTFLKNLNPEEAVVAAGHQVVFHRPVRPDGGKASYGIFETKDAAVAEALREVAKSRPTLYVFEKT